MTSAAIPFHRPYLTGRETAYAAEAIRSGQTQGDGPFTRRLEAAMRERLGAPVLVTGSCTAALDMSALLLELGPGDEVVMPSFTFPSTANAVCLRGARPRFVDIEEATLNIDLDAAARAIGERTRAIWPVHYAGVPCDMGRLTALAERHGLRIVEDAAQAWRCSWRGRPLGTVGDLGCISFHQSKTFSAGEAGALVVNDADLLARAEMLREKGTDRRAFLNGQVDKYGWRDVGSSFLASDIAAAVALAQIEAADEIVARRRRLYERYDRLLAPLYERGVLRGPRIPDGVGVNYHIYYVLARTPAERDALIEALGRDGIQATSHYVPLHSSAYARRAGLGADLPVTDRIAATLLRLPFFTAMTEAEQDRVAAALGAYFAIAETAG